jgi:hypothetical protein
MIIIKEQENINLNDLSVTLNAMGIDKLNIFYINIDSTYNGYIRSEIGSDVKFIELNPEEFTNLLNINVDFLSFNPYSLYITRGANFLDIKNLFASIENSNVNLGRGGGQKSHMLSPLDFRLSTYLMAMFKFNYKFIKNLNTFDQISKDRYLSYTDQTIRKVYSKNTSLEFKALIVNKMPFYPINLHENLLDCPCKKN